MDNNLHQQIDSAQGGVTRKTPSLIILVRVLFLLNALIWLLLSVLFINRMAGGLTSISSMLWVVFALMLANALVFAWIGWGLGSLKKRFYYLGIAVLAINIILSITDEFGWLDLATMLIDVLLLGLLIATRSRYINKKRVTGCCPVTQKDGFAPIQATAYERFIPSML